MLYRFEIPFAAVVKKNGRSIGYNRRTGRMYPIKSQRLKEYESQVIACLKQQLQQYQVELPLLTGDVTARYWFYFKGKCRADLNNLNAALQDCAETVGIFKNDRQIVHEENFKFEDTGEDRTVVEYLECT